MRAPSVIASNIKKQSRGWLRVRGNCKLGVDYGGRVHLVKSNCAACFTFKLPVWWIVLLIFLFRSGSNLSSLLSLFGYSSHLGKQTSWFISSNFSKQVPSAPQKRITLLQSSTSNFTILDLFELYETIVILTCTAYTSHNCSKKQTLEMLESAASFCPGSLSLKKRCSEKRISTWMGSYKKIWAVQLGKS